MLEAGGWGLLAASSLVLGAILSFTGWIRARPLRLITAFGAGVLISAVAYELVEETVLESAGGVAVATGFVLGSLVFYGGFRARRAMEFEARRRDGHPLRSRA